MEIQRTAGASTFVTFPMLSNTGVPQSGLTVVGNWLAWADTAGPGNGNGFRVLTGAVTELAGGVYYNALASTELPAASPYVMLRYSTAGIATQYLLVRTASLFANVQAVTAGAITSGSFAAGAITAAVIATGAIDADALAADTITAAKLAADVTTELQNGLATSAALATVDGKIDTIDTNVDAVLVDTGTTLNDKIDVIDGIVDSILVDTAEIGAAGAGLTAINLPDQTMAITGNITGNLSGSVGSVTGAVGSVTGAVGSVGAGGIATTTFAAGAIDAAAIAANAIGASELAADGASEYADAFLGRNLHRGASGGRTVGQAMMALRNKVSISAGTLTVTGEDDSTTEWTATIATEAVTAIVTSIDPA